MPVAVKQGSSIIITSAVKKHPNKDIGFRMCMRVLKIFYYGMTADKIPDVMHSLEKYVMTTLSENQSITLKVSKMILVKAM